MSSGLPIGHEKYKPYVLDMSKVRHVGGDINFIEYGGTLLVPGLEEDDEPHLEHIQEPYDDGPKEWTVYQVEPERKKLVEIDQTIYLVCIRYKQDWPHPVTSYNEWFHKDLESVASYVGVSFQDLRDNLCSEDPLKRAESYIDLAAYHGWHEFDHYPLRLSEHEVHERYNELEDCRCSLCEPLQEEDKEDD